jgi:hypothetical protein
MQSWLDEGGLWLRDAGVERQRLALDDISDVLDEVLAHADEELLSAGSIYDAEVRAGVPLYELLFDPACGGPSLRDARVRLAGQLQRVRSGDDAPEAPAPPTEPEARAPSLSLLRALAAAAGGAPVALLAFATAPPPPGAPGGGPIWPVTRPADRPPFARAWLLAAPPRPAAFAPWLARAFPRLGWADGATKGLHQHAGCFFGDRFADTIRHLGVLSDHGAEIFSAEALPEAREGHLGALRVPASGESPKTRANAKARRQRTGAWRGEEVVFWWHTKIRPTEGRIHFHHDPEPPPGRIVIGKLCDHFDT